MSKGRKSTLRARPALERIMRIHQSVLSGERPTASGLARELEVDRRTVTRDITFMRDRWNLPLEYSALQGGFIYTGPVDALPGAVITEGELFSVLIAEKALQQYRGTVFERRLKSAFDKMTEIMPESVTLNLDDWSQSVTFRSSAIPNQDIETFDILARGVTQQRQIEILYRKPRAKKSEKRIVDPHHLACIDGEWYLFAYDHKQRDIRIFKPTRMEDISMTGESFERRKAFSLDKHLRGAFERWTNAQRGHRHPVEPVPVAGDGCAGGGGDRGGGGDTTDERATREIHFLPPRCGEYGHIVQGGPRATLRS